MVEWYYQGRYHEVGDHAVEVQACGHGDRTARLSFEWAIEFAPDLAGCAEEIHFDVLRFSINTVNSD